MAKTKVKNISSLGKLGTFRVEAVDLEFSNGEERTYYRLAPRHHAVTSVALDGDDLILISEFAGGALDYELGFVRGGIDDGESIEEAAARELAEEAYLIGNKVTSLGHIWNSPGYQTGIMYFFLFEELTEIPLEQRLPGDEPEPLEITRWSISRLDELFTHPNFRDARNMVCLFRLRDYLKERGRI